MKKLAVCAAMAVLSVVNLPAQSLWDPASEGWITGKTRLKEGELIRVLLDTEASLSFTSTKASDKLITLDFLQAGKDPNPVEFLPQIKSGDTIKLQNKNEYKAKNSQLTVTVKEVLPSGVARIEGQRRVAFPGGADEIRLRGLVDPRDLKNREIKMNFIADLEIQFSTAAEASSSTLKPADLGPDGKLTPEKQRELLIKYFNRFLGTLFPGS